MGLGFFQLKDVEQTLWAIFNFLKIGEIATKVQFDFKYKQVLHVLYLLCVDEEFITE